MNFLGFLAPLLGIIMEWIYKLIPSYGWTLIIFTLLTKILMFPLSVKQQKSTARMSAYQPMMQEIQKKWANDKNRQQEELMKFQQETGMSMTAGCLPMAVNFLVLFGLIEVVYRPLQYILRVPKELIDKAVELANSALGMNLMANNFTVQNDIINAVKSSPDVFSSVFSADQIASISDFNFMFLGIDLSRVPHFAFDAASLMLMIIPILSVVTMILSQIITMKMSGQEMQGAMKWMPWIMSLMFVYFGFTVPVGFSLYYTASNVVMLVQSIILKKMYDPEEMKKQVQAEIEAKRAEKKKKKQVKVTTDDGREQVKEVSEAELARIRLARARELDVAGLVKGASRGEGLGNKFLSHIREVDAIVHVVRCFEDENVIHVDGSVDPARDIDVINTELALAELGVSAEEAGIEVLELPQRRLFKSIPAKVLRLCGG